MQEKFRIVTEADYEELVRLRCHFHENPECGPDEQFCTMMDAVKKKGAITSGRKADASFGTGMSWTVASGKCTDVVLKTPFIMNI